ncbi:MAG: SMP-30/gluconolactonase/LRE family protein [Candidatus Latescibacteria bacterium]|nr:SMP-30/gluconolactonase/LRE family protein [Candidatus Latescibacterota bacterium]
MAGTPEVLVDNLYFPEGPRWRVGDDGKGWLWFSDVLAGQVRRVDLSGHCETIAEVPELPSGLGWWPDGTLVVVSLGDGKLMSIGDDGEVRPVADMKALDGLSCNDMVLGPDGRGYVGSFQELDEDRLPGPGNMPAFSHIHLVEPDPDQPGQGRCRIVADRMTFPNGPVITPDGKTYLVAETFANRITAFDIEADGSLSNRRVWADLGAPTDGMTLDEEGCLWVAIPYYAYGGPGGFVRVREGGELVDRIDADGVGSFACTLGGPELKSLFLLQSTSLGVERSPGDGRIMVAEVDVPGLGTP